MLDSKTDPSLRHQILSYVMSEVMTDVERARMLGLPPGCRIRERAKILCQEKLRLGQNIWIGEGAVLDAQGGLSIGDNTQIGLNVMVWSHSSHKQAVEGKTGSPTKEGIVYKETRIGSNCFIAGPSVIAAGVTLGDRVVVSPLSYVDRDLADDVVFSPPLELARATQKIERLEQRIQKLMKELEQLRRPQ